MTIIEVSIDADLEESLEQIASEQGTSVEKVLNDLAREYVRQARRAKIAQEFEAYQAIHPQLKEKLLGKHVAIHDGQLIDSDSDPMVLVARVQEQFGRVPILFTQVDEQPTREITIRSPRLVKPTQRG
jgi:hypothetical protein